MKLEKQQLQQLMNRHIHELTREELEALALITSVTITDYSKTNREVKFKLTHAATTVFVECDSGSNASIGRSNEVIDNLSGLTSWGGVHSFADILKTFRTFYLREFELTLDSAVLRKIYGSREKCFDMVQAAQDQVEKTIKKTPEKV